MTTGELASRASATVRHNALPWAGLADLGGLGVALALAIGQSDLHRNGFFLYTLLGSGLITWLLIAQLRPRLPGLVRVGYRFVFAAPLAAAFTLAACAATRDYYSRSAVIVFVVAWMLWVAVWRYALRRMAQPVHVLCIGDDRLARELARQPRFQVDVVRSPRMEYRPADLVVVTEDAAGDQRWFPWLLHAEMAGVPLMSAHRAREALSGRVPIELLAEAWAREEIGRWRPYLPVKRALDVAAVVIASPLLLVLSALVAIAVLIESGRPVIFSQLRIGQEGNPFRIYKFRTMRKDAERDGAAFARERDPRVTPLGRFLRKTRLDELPQFWNVLLGDMSIIGPRPEQVGFAERFGVEVPLYTLRHGVRPGITGWAQVRQGYAAGAEESAVKVSYDLYYVKHCSPALDLLVALKTVAVLLSFSGAR